MGTAMGKGLYWEVHKSMFTQKHKIGSCLRSVDRAFQTLGLVQGHLPPHDQTASHIELSWMFVRGEWVNKTGQVLEEVGRRERMQSIALNAFGSAIGSLTHEVSKCSLMVYAVLGVVSQALSWNEANNVSSHKELTDTGWVNMQVNDNQW